MFNFKVNKLINKAKAEGFFWQCFTFSQHSAQSKSHLWKIHPARCNDPQKIHPFQPLPIPPAKNKENSPPSQNPNRNRKNDESGLFASAHDPLNRSGLFLHQIVRLNNFDYAHPPQTRSKWKIPRNLLRTNNNKLQQTTLLSQSSINHNPIPKTKPSKTIKAVWSKALNIH